MITRLFAYFALTMTRCVLRLNGMKRKVEGDQQALKVEAEQIRAKMDFQVRLVFFW